MLIFVFAGEGSGMAYNKLTDNGSATPAGLVAASLSHAFALFVAVSVGANISGGHVNHAVTFGAFIGGHITLIKGLLYWIAQLLGSVVACSLLKIATGGLGCRMLKVFHQHSEVINIHHGLLPSFKGRHPSKQAFEAGVKLIDATRHFVTEELDTGPIIEQMSFVQKSENLEKQCLSKVIKSYCELQVLPYEGKKTVVF